jgi:hypothetical protein
MKRIGYIISIVLLCGLAAEKASALTYVMTPEARRKLEAEYRTLTEQKRQTESDIKRLCGVLSSSQRVFVYSLYGSKRWECWTTNQVTTRLRQLYGNQATYRAWWKYLAGQHMNYSRYVRNQLLPSLQDRLRKINSRLGEVRSTLANTGTIGGDKTGLSNVTVNTSPIYVKVWDHSKQDGDIVQVFLNGRFLRQVSLVKGGTTITLPLQYGQHRLEVLAMNQGSEGPNTASLSITGVVKGKPRQSWRLKTGQRAGMWITVGR